MNSRQFCITIGNSPYPSSVYIKLSIQSKRNVYYFYKKSFPEKKKQNSLFTAPIKRNILTSREVLYTKFSPYNKFLFCKNDAFQNKDF